MIIWIFESNLEFVTFSKKLIHSTNNGPKHMYKEKFAGFVLNFFKF